MARKRPGNRKAHRKGKAPRKVKTKRHAQPKAGKAGRSAPRRRTAALTPKTTKRVRRRPESDPRLELAVREMNHGSSLTATARSLGMSPRNLKDSLRRMRLLRRKGNRWVVKDNRPRRVPVMTGGRFRIVTVPGYAQASLVGKHHHAVGEFVRTNDIQLITPFRGRSISSISGKRYPLEADPNALHRIAAMDTPPFHEIYGITSNT